MAGRKEYELLFKLQAALGGNFNAAFRAATNAVKEQQNALSRLNSVVGKIDAYRYTFSKNETEIEITLATPLPADAMITKAIMSVTRQIPAGAEFTVEVCNNGNDDSPTWEDVTQAVNSGSKFFLSNETKTAESWGFNFRIKVKRNGASGDCFISSVGGNFE